MILMSRPPVLLCGMKVAGHYFDSTTTWPPQPGVKRCPHLCSRVLFHQDNFPGRKQPDNSNSDGNLFSDLLKSVTMSVKALLSPFHGNKLFVLDAIVLISRRVQSFFHITCHKHLLCVFAQQNVFFEQDRTWKKDAPQAPKKHTSCAQKKEI